MYDIEIETIQSDDDFYNIEIEFRNKINIKYIILKIIYIICNLLILSGLLCYYILVVINSESYEKGVDLITTVVVVLIFIFSLSTIMNIVYTVSYIVDYCKLE